MSIGAPVNERLAALTEAGVSVWLDQIRRTLITEGELQQLIDEYSLRGMTSNPAIFEKAILGSDDYDDDLRELSGEGLDASQIFLRLAIKDVQLAADLLKPVWDEADGADGFVSLEVSPSLAHDTDGTLEEARSFWERVDRPNVMIKIPGTEEGLPAIEQAIYEGINVNVTLLFKVESYVAVTERFIRGMERRHEEGKSLDIHSVASFFVSRVDTEVDRRLEELGRTDLQGLAGVANAREAYMRFKEIFLGERFAQLRDAGAPVQRPLWASTGVKNPKYRDTLYVDELVAPHTVNTMPMATLHATAEQSEFHGASADQDPAADLKALADAGVDMSDVTDTLLREGIDKFVEPFDELIRGVESAREAAVMERPPTISSSVPDKLEPLIIEHIERSQKEDVVRRIWRKDATLWASEGTPEIADRLGWLTISDAMLDQVPDLEAFAGECQSAGLEHAVLLGMGGSSLGPEVLRRSFPDALGLTLHVLDSTDPGAILETERSIDLDKTMFVVSSKSGGTIETLSQMRYFYERCGGDGSRFCAVTDPGSPLVDEAKSRGFRRVFEADPNIGGRYSVLSHFGLVPAALAGIDIEALLKGAQVAEQNCQSPAPESNSGLWMGVAVGALALQGRDKATFAVDDPVASFGLWVEQLIAESTGKQGKGILPVAGEPVGDPGEYGDDRVFVHLRNEQEPDEALGQSVEALARAGQPVLKLTHDGAADLGRVFFFAEFAVAVAGWVLGINPFDQPNVQEAKDNTSKVLQAGDLPELDPGDMADLLDGAAPPHYLAIMGYVQPSDEFDAAVTEMRVELRKRTSCATTFGYGPRFLHSTGQLHKGGPPTGRFLQLIHDGDEDVEIPDAGYSFRHLKNAQAVGDLQTLRDHGLPAVQVRLEGDPAQALRRLI
jgi:transaldolase / glucose-6-phosphate isomerase